MALASATPQSRSSRHRLRSVFGEHLTILAISPWRTPSPVSFFFLAEDGIRTYKVTGVQTCALPICPLMEAVMPTALPRLSLVPADADLSGIEIGRASCRKECRSRGARYVCNKK